MRQTLPRKPRLTIRDLKDKILNSLPISFKTHMAPTTHKVALATTSIQHVLHFLGRNTIRSIFFDLALTDRFVDIYWRASASGSDSSSVQYTLYWYMTLNMEAKETITLSDGSVVELAPLILNTATRPTSMEADAPPEIDVDIFNDPTAQFYPLPLTSPGEDCAISFSSFDSRYFELKELPKPKKQKTGKKAHGTHIAWTFYAKTDGTPGLFVRFHDENNWASVHFMKFAEHSSGAALLFDDKVVIYDDKYLSDVKNKNLPPDKPVAGASGESALWPTAAIHVCEKAFTDVELFNSALTVAARESAKAAFMSAQLDPYMPEDIIKGQDLNFPNGDKAELHSLVPYIFHAGLPFTLWDSLNISQLVVFIASKTDLPQFQKEATLDVENMGYEGDTWKNIVAACDPTAITAITSGMEAVLKEHTPAGFSYEWNDGFYDRASGYKIQPHSITYRVTKPSAHEVMTAKVELVRFKSEHPEAAAAVDAMLAASQMPLVPSVEKST